MYLYYLLLQKLLKVKLHLNKSISMKYVYIFAFFPKVLQFQPKIHFPQGLNHLSISQSNHYIIEICKYADF